MGDRPDCAPVQCHFISNTHWDREWRYSMQRTRHNGPRSCEYYGLLHSFVKAEKDQIAAVPRGRIAS